MKHEVGLWENAAISPVMAGAMNAWMEAFYGDPDWKIGNIRLSELPPPLPATLQPLSPAKWS